MPTYDEMLEYVLDAGKECECCVCGDWCKGITMGPNGPLFPPCSSKDFRELLDADCVANVYQEDHADD